VSLRSSTTLLSTSVRLICSANNRIACSPSPPNGVTLTSTSEPRKTVVFNANRWAYFVGLTAKIDEEAKELNCQTRPVAFRKHVNDGYYDTLTSDVICVGIRKFYAPYGLCSDQLRPSKSRIALRLDVWAELMTLIPSIHAVFPALVKAKRCIVEESHVNQVGWLDCSSCFPFGKKHSY